MESLCIYDYTMNLIKMQVDSYLNFNLLLPSMNFLFVKVKKTLNNNKKFPFTAFRFLNVFDTLYMTHICCDIAGNVENHDFFQIIRSNVSNKQTNTIVFLGCSKQWYTFPPCVCC